MFKQMKDLIARNQSSNGNHNSVAKRTVLSLETLEDRAVPASFGL